MSEDQAGYTVNDQPAAIIDPPRMVKALREKGLADYKVWGWVKKSANFIYHIKILKGSKLAIWDVISLSIDEDGTCSLSAPSIANLTGYSVSEVRQSIAELEEMGYLDVVRSSGKHSIYKPEFTARGTNTPTDNPSRKSTPPVATVQRADDPSSPSIGNSVSSYKELKELKEKKHFSLTQKEKDQVNEQVDYMLFNNDPSKAWRGRELLPAHYLPYGDWWHAKTGLHMYGAKAKAKTDAEWLTSCKALWENEVTPAALDAAWKAEEWRAAKMTKLSQIVPAAKLAQAAGGTSSKLSPVQYEPDGTPISW